MGRTTLSLTLLAATCAAAVADALAGPGWFIGSPLLVVAPAVAGYAVGWCCRPPVAVAAGVLAAGVLTTANQLAGQDYHWLDDLVFFLVVAGGPAAAGVAVTTRAAQVRRLERLQAELDEQRRVDVAAARLEEQTRVQQEVHARLAERIGAIALRARGAEQTADPTALGVIETEARSALDQLRDTLGSLRSEPAGQPPAEDPVPPPPQPSLLDAALVVALFAGLVVESQVSQHARGPAWAGVLGAALVTAPLLVRRAHPILATSAAMAAALATSPWLTPISATVTGVAFLVLVFYTIGAWCRDRSWLLGWAVATAGMLGLEPLSGLTGDADSGDGAWIVLLWAVGAVVLGRVTAGWQDRVRRTERTLAELERARGAEVRLAAAQERQALASELHDTVAHAMTVVCLQAGAAQRTPGTQPGALHTIASTAATSLAELRDGLEAIETSANLLEPARLSALARRVGVDAVVRVEPVPAGPAAGLAFRVVREALVNVARHAPGATATVTVACQDGDVVVEVVDRGGRAGGFAEGSGTGLAGLSAAVTETGGHLSWGPHDAGFRVRATIPGGGS